MKFNYRKHQLALLMCNIDCKRIYEFLLTSLTNTFRRVKLLIVNVNQHLIPRPLKQTNRAEINRCYFLYAETKKSEKFTKYWCTGTHTEKNIYQMQEYNSIAIMITILMIFVYFFSEWKCAVHSLSLLYISIKFSSSNFFPIKLKLCDNAKFRRTNWNSCSKQMPEIKRFNTKKKNTRK